VIAAVLAQLWATLVLSGAVDAAQVASNVAAVDVEPGTLPDLAEDPVAYWAARSARAWS
jgi:aryl-alcohol dehydrogenase-like predicted oxidoreductase